MVLKNSQIIGDRYATSVDSMGIAREDLGRQSNVLVQMIG